MSPFPKDILPEQAEEKKVVMAKAAGLLYLLSTTLVLLTLHLLPQPPHINLTILDGIGLLAIATGLFFLFADWQHIRYQTFYRMTFITLLYIATFIYFSGGASSGYGVLYLLLIFWASFYFNKVETFLTAVVTAFFCILPLIYDREASITNNGTDEIILVSFIFLLGWAVNLLSHQRETAYLKERRSSAERSQFALQLETLQRISKELSAELELDRLLRMILSEGMNLLKFEVGGLFLWEEERNAYIVKTVVHLPEAFIGRAFKRGEGLIGLVAEERRMVIDDSVTSPIKEFAGLDFKTHIGIPILWKGEVIGVFNMAGTDRRKIVSIEDQKLAEMLAQHAAVAIQNARLFKEGQEQARRQAVLYKVVRAVSSEMTPQETLNAMARIAAESVDASFAVLLLQNGTTIEPRGAYQVPPVDSPFFSEAFKIAATRETSPAMISIQERKVVTLPDLQQEKEIPAPLRHAALQFGFGSLMSVPLVFQEQTYGALVVYFRQARSFFTRQEFDILSALASEAAVAVRHLKWMEERERHFARTEALREIAQEIGAELQLPRILNLVVERGMTLLGLDEGAVVLWDKYRQEYVVRVSVGYESPIVDMVVQPGMGITSEIIRLKKTVLIEDYQHFPNAIPAIQALGVQAAIGTPVFLKETLIGVLILETKKVGARFTPEDRQTIEILARHAALAIENARLYEEARSLNEHFALLTKEVSLSRDFAQVFAHVAENLKRQLDYDWFGITLHHTSEGASEEIMLAHIGNPIKGFPLHAISPSAQSVLFSVIRDQQPLICHNLAEGPRYQEDILLLREGFRSYCIIPVILKGEVLATLNLLSRKPHQFSESQADVLLPLANHLAPFIENARLFEELKKKKREAEEASRIKSEFVSSVSHELRTPLNAILGYGSLLLQETFGEINRGQEEALTSLHRNAKELLELINNILDLSKIESGKSALQCEPVNLKSLLGETFENLKPLLQEKALGIEWNVQEDLSEIQSDRLKVRQVILNLLSNAIKFTEKGTIHISAKNSSEPPGILLSVQDTGIGMREEDIPTIFDPFRQIDGSLTRQAGGTGLGLSIVKNILEVLQGHIEVESRLGIGSTFTVFFPHMEKECEKSMREN
jgi:signal transduction histidine kinase